MKFYNLAAVQKLVYEMSYSIGFQDIGLEIAYDSVNKCLVENPSDKSSETQVLIFESAEEYKQFIGYGAKRCLQEMKDDFYSRQKYNTGLSELIARMLANEYSYGLSYMSSKAKLLNILDRYDARLLSEFRQQQIDKYVPKLLQDAQEFDVDKAKQLSAVYLIDSSDPYDKTPHDTIVAIATNSQVAKEIIQILNEDEKYEKYGERDFSIEGIEKVTAPKPAGYGE